MVTFPKLSDSEILARLEPPAERVPMVLDTDAFNELDDQFVIVYALLSERLNAEAIYAAPFFHGRSTSPGDGMEKSYQEILTVLERMDIEPDGLAFRGADRYLPSRTEPVESAAALDLVERAMSSREGPLYVVPIGAPTNVASALLIAPELVRRIVVVWVGGPPHDWSPAGDFNLRQDLAASQVLFDSGVPLVQIPCRYVAENLRTTIHEIEFYVKGRGRIGDYLCEVYRRVAKDRYAGSRVLWDVAGAAWLVNSEWVKTRLVPSPVLTDDLAWGPLDASRHPVRVGCHAARDPIFTDLFSLLERQTPNAQSGASGAENS